VAGTAESPNYDGMAIAGFLLAFVALSEFNAKGLMDARSIGEKIDRATLFFEQMGLTGADAGAKSAHALLKQLLPIFDELASNPKSP